MEMEPDDWQSHLTYNSAMAMGKGVSIGSCRCMSWPWGTENVSEEKESGPSAYCIVIKCLIRVIG